LVVSRRSALWQVIVGTGQESRHVHQSHCWRECGRAEVRVVRRWQGSIHVPGRRTRLSEKAGPAEWKGRGAGTPLPGLGKPKRQERTTLRYRYLRSIVPAVAKPGPRYRGQARPTHGAKMGKTLLVRVPSRSVWVRVYMSISCGGHKVLQLSAPQGACHSLVAALLCHLPCSPSTSPVQPADLQCTARFPKFQRLSVPSFTPKAASVHGSRGRIFGFCHDDPVYAEWTEALPACIPTRASLRLVARPADGAIAGPCPAHFRPSLPALGTWGRPIRQVILVVAGLPPAVSSPSFPSPCRRRPLCSAQRRHRHCTA
jgi:hypothetical protein